MLNTPENRKILKNPKKYQNYTRDFKLEDKLNKIKKPSLLGCIWGIIFLGICIVSTRYLAIFIWNNFEGINDKPSSYILAFFIVFFTLMFLATIKSKIKFKVTCPHCKNKMSLQKHYLYKDELVEFDNENILSSSILDITEEFDDIGYSNIANKLIIAKSGYVYSFTIDIMRVESEKDDIIEDQFRISKIYDKWSVCDACKFIVCRDIRVLDSDDCFVCGDLGMLNQVVVYLQENEFTGDYDELAKILDDMDKL